MSHRDAAAWVFAAAALSVAVGGGCHGARDAECKAWSDAYRAQNLGMPHDESQFSRGKGKAEPTADIVKALRAFTSAMAPKPGQKATEVTPLIAAYVVVVDERATLLERAGTPAEVEKKKAELEAAGQKAPQTPREKALADAVDSAWAKSFGETLSDATYQELDANKQKGEPIWTSLWNTCGNAIP